MKTTRSKYAWLAVIAAATIGVNSPRILAAGPDDSAAALDESRKEKALDGKIESIDVEGKTFTLGGKVIYTTDTTKFTRGKDTIMLSDLKVGYEVHVMTHDTYDGKVEATSVDVRKSS